MSTVWWGQTADFTLRVEVPVVTVEVSVTTPDGRGVDGLVASDFEVLDGGEPQPIRYFGPWEAPWSVYLLLDGSSSTRAQREFMAEVVAAVLSEVRPQDRVAIGVFGEEVETVLDWDDTPDAGFRMPTSASLGTGTTAFYESLERVLANEFEEIGERKAVIVLTDGRDVSLYQPLQREGRLLALEDDSAFQDMEDTAARSRIPVYVVALNTDTNLSNAAPGNEYRSLEALYPGSDMPNAYLRQVRLRMERLAEMTGGEILLPATPEEAAPSLAGIARKLGAAYSLGWVPPSGTEGIRSIEVRVRDAAYEVRTSRTQYRPAE